MKTRNEGCCEQRRNGGDYHSHACDGNVKPAHKRSETVKRGEHTPTPWKVESKTIITGHPQNRVIANCETVSRDFTEEEANAAFIVRAVNSHEALLEALKNIERRLTKGLGYGADMASSREVCLADGLELAQQAIAQAEGR